MTRRRLGSGLLVILPTVQAILRVENCTITAPFWKSYIKGRSERPLLE